MKEICLEMVFRIGLEFEVQENFTTSYIYISLTLRKGDLQRCTVSVMYFLLTMQPV